MHFEFAVGSLQYMLYSITYIIVDYTVAAIAFIVLRLVLALL